MKTILNDLKYAWRTLRKMPVFTAIAVLSIGLGIGANTAIFSVVNAVLLTPPPFKDADRIVVLWETNETIGAMRNAVSGANTGDGFGKFPGQKPGIVTHYYKWFSAAHNLFFKVITYSLGYDPYSLKSKFISYNTPPAVSPKLY